MELTKVIDIIESNALDCVRFEQTDLYGIARSKTIPARHFRSKASGGINTLIDYMAFDPASAVISGTGIGEELGFCDAVSFPDYDTFIILPWCEKTGRILVEPTYKGASFSAYPRTLARRQLNRLKDLGLSLLSAHEHEFSVVHRDTGEPIYRDNNIHATIRNNFDMKFTYQIMKQLPLVGVDIECVESETAPGQYEISYAPSYGIRSADNAHTFRIGVKEIALQHGYTASFMTVPFKGQLSNALHVCHSLWDTHGKEPLLFDPNEPNGLSQIAQHWIAGLVFHAPAISLLMAPTVNCVSQFRKDAWTPHHATWGIDNRTAAIRVKLNGAKGTYIENRLGGGGSNPYITLAATLIAGIDGLERKLPLTNPRIMDDPVPPKTALIPNTMKDALKAFLDDKVITEALGKEFVQIFSAAKIHEMKLEQKAKSKGDDDWERKLYFEYL